MAAPRAPLSRATRTRRRLTVLLLMLAGAISYIDRTALSISNTAVSASMGLSLGEMGLLLSIFAWAYLIAQIPTGLAADRIGSRSLLGAGLVIWSVAQMAFGLVSTVPGLFLSRFALGLGEAPLFLSGTRALVRWYAPAERGRPLGLFNASAALGPALAPPLLLALMALWGWRGMSVAIGGASLLLAAVWIAFYRDPSHVHLPQTGPAAPGSVKPQQQHSLRALLRRRATWILAMGYGGVIYLTWLYATWMPAWLETSRHLSPTTAGLLSTLPQFCGFIGSILGGMVCDQLSARGYAPLAACRQPIVTALLLAALATTLTTAPLPLALMIALMALALFCGGLAMSCGWVLATVIAADDQIATLEAIQNTGASAGGALAPALTGILAQYTGSFGPPLWVAGLVTLLSAAAYHFGLTPSDAAAADDRPNSNAPRHQDHPEPTS